MSAVSRLTLREIRKAYGDTPILRGIDIEVAAGEILVLLGESGSGKSTLLRLIAGLARADHGTIEVDGRLVSGPSLHRAPQLRSVGLVFQDLELWPHMTVAEHLAFALPGEPTGRRAAEDERVLSLADQVGLGGALLRRRPGTLSGGERQRVAIARTLGAKPGVMLYDEPLASLDPSRRVHLRRLIRALCVSKSNEAGAHAAIYVTHDPDEAMALGDRVAVLDQGRLLQVDTPTALYGAPMTMRVARALGGASALPGTVAGDRIVTQLGEGTIHPVCFHRMMAEGGSGLRTGQHVETLLRPEQVVPAGAGAEAEIIEVFARGAVQRFQAKLISDGTLLEGESATSLSTGDVVRLALRGKIACLAEGAAPEPTSAALIQDGEDEAQ